jgi:antitoxin component of MazEF toxin-antitoxin module
MLRTKIRKVGNSHGLLLPADVVRYWKLKPGTEVELSFDADRLIVRPVAGDRAAFVEALGEVLDEDAGILEDLAK